MPSILKNLNDATFVSVTVKNTGNVNISSLEMQIILTQDTALQTIVAFSDFKTVSLNVGEQKVIDFVFPNGTLKRFQPMSTPVKVTISYSIDGSGFQPYNTDWEIFVIG
jgi:hypothetical protein